MSNALNHIEYLSVKIGPRGSTTSKEKAGHEYVHKVLSGLGCAPRMETYQSPTSTYTPFILGLGLVLVAEILYWFIARGADGQMGALAALVISLAAFISLLLELLGNDNPLRWLVPTAPSQNVIGVTAAKDEAKQKVAVIAHVDSHRTPLFFRTPVTFAVYRTITTLALVSLVALCVTYAIAIFAPRDALHTYSLIPAAIVLLAWLMVVQAHFTPFAAGANDNASGVGVMLSLAEQLKKKPLANIEVWWVATGCEEVGAYGSLDFAQRYADEFDEGAVIIVDNIAAKDTGPVYLDREGIVVPANYPAEMLELANQIAAQNPKLGGRVISQQGAYTDGYYALKAGLNTLTFVGYQKDGWIPNWHNPLDVFANVDADAVERTEQFVLKVLERLDGGRETGEAKPRKAAPARAKRPARSVSRTTARKRRAT